MNSKKRNVIEILNETFIVKLIDFSLKILQCQTHSDCCSKSCLSFSYKCTQIHKPVQEENQRPTSNEDITNRFTAVTNTANNTCAESGAYVSDKNFILY